MFRKMLIEHIETFLDTTPSLWPTKQVNVLLLAASVILNGAALTLKDKTASYN